MLALATLKQVMEEKARPATARRCLLPRACGASAPTSRRACAAGDREQRGHLKGRAALPPVHAGGGGGGDRAAVSACVTTGPGMDASASFQTL